MFRLLALIYYWDVWHRRICPGRYVAVQSMWAAMACILATLRITNAKDEHGNPIAVVPEFTTGVAMCVSHYHDIHSRLKAHDARHPKPFPCSIEARSSRAEQLIQSRDCKWCQVESNIFYYETLFRNCSTVLYCSNLLYTLFSPSPSICIVYSGFAFNVSILQQQCMSYDQTWLLSAVLLFLLSSCGG